MSNKTTIKDILEINKYDIDLGVFKEEELDHIIVFLEGIYKNTNKTENKKVEELSFDSLTSFAEDIINKTKEIDNDNEKDA